LKKAVYNFCHFIGLVFIYCVVLQAPISAQSTIKKSDNEQLQIISEHEKYINLESLNSISDRHPEIFKIIKLRVPPPTDYWFKGHFGAHLNVQIDYIRVYARANIGKQTNGNSQFEVFLNKEGIIDSVKTLHYTYESINQNEVIKLLKLCRWKPALLNLNPVDVNFIMEIKFVD